MLEVVDLACTRGTRRLFFGLSFDLKPGTLLHVCGLNGSGKTTLLRALSGLLTPDDGEIRWEGESIRHLGDDYHADLVYSGHLNGIKNDLTGIENLRVSATLGGEQADDERLWTALERMGLTGFEDLPTKVLSQGQKRRVVLARLLVSNAPLWILDEPFSALDVDAVGLLQTLIAGHLDKDGTVVLTTHQEIPLTSGQMRRLYLGE
jgi:heme exporter protein A